MSHVTQPEAIEGSARGPQWVLLTGMCVLLSQRAMWLTCKKVAFIHYYLGEVMEELNSWRRAGL